ncbi:MAG: helix-turn-helix domain-containing protein [Candidatus Muirbacterium halophilum]|nr:helix-turn-helix domain-containing protein [Candidatus Muirbacterium halophilum]MCK9476830.1 helix-turn-helix domain-containing protein [Candidatus Muirbacterium halophilum]
MNSLNNLRKEIGFRLKVIRKSKNFTLTAMSQILDTSPSFLSEIENGKKFPSINILHKLASKLMVSLDFVINDLQKADYVIPFIDEPNKFYTIKNFDKHIMDFYPESSIFCYQARDNNMLLEGITKETVVLIAKTNDINSGNIVLVKNENEIILRKYFRTCDKNILCTEAIDKNVHVMFEPDKFQIIGKVLGVIKYF